MKTDNRDVKFIKLIIYCTFQLALVHGEKDVGTTVQLVFMDTDVVVGAIVVIGRNAIQNKDVSRVNKEDINVSECYINVT